MPTAVQHEYRRPLQCAVTVVDNHGRVAAAALLQALEWTPGTLVAFTVNTEALVTAARTTSRPADFAPRRVIRRHGHLHIPANIRHRAGITAGDRLLLATEATGMLHIFPAQLLAHILHRYLTQQHP